jgi:hypothetical protein
MNPIIEEGLEWRRIFWVNGSTPKGSSYRNTVSNPPCNGWQSAFVILGEKRSVVFCPYTFESFPMPNDAAELIGSLPNDVTTKTRIWLKDILKRKWQENQTLGLMKDYDTAALVFRRFGMEPPQQLVKGGEEDVREKGGKQPAKELLKPVRRKGKRGDFLQYFLDNFGSRSVREAMADLEMTRSNVLSYLFIIQKDHGIGYRIIGDTVDIVLPDGVDGESLWA